MARKRALDRSISQMEDEQDREAAEISRDRKILLANFSKALHDKSCRSLIWEILCYTGIYDVNTSCDQSVFFTEGKRFVGQDILALLHEVDPALYPRMITENMERSND